jgi:hypothetical protein
MSAFHFSDGQSVVEGDFSQLENLIGALKEKHYVDIGVFGTGITIEGRPVAEYGAYNEFGSISRPDHPPKRSFIRMPLQTKQDKIGQYVKKHAQAHMEKADIKAILEDIGHGGVSAIQEAFDTRGFGTWKPNAESTIKRKGGDAPLITGADTMLRKQITYRTE